MYKILVCDDEIKIRETFSDYLSAKGFDVTLAGNGEEAVRKTQENDFDLIILDVMMPVMNGLEASSAIRSLDRTDAKEIPIIAMTANAFDDDVSKSIAHGMNDHLAKPVQPDKLFATLGMYLGC